MMTESILEYGVVGPDGIIPGSIEPTEIYAQGNWFGWQEPPSQPNPEPYPCCEGYTVQPVRVSTAVECRFTPTEFYNDYLPACSDGNVTAYWDEIPAFCPDCGAPVVVEGEVVK